MWNLQTDTAILRELGERLTRERLNQNRTQQQVAEEAGLGLRTLQRLENGEASTNLSSFIRICRVLRLLDRFESLFPKNIMSPLQQVKLERQQRKRARTKSKPNPKKPKP